MGGVVAWLGCDLVTGRIIAELPDLAPQGTVGVLLAAYTSSAFTLPIPLGGNGSAPAGWQATTEPGRTMIVAVLGGRPVWAGIVMRRVAGSAATASLACATLEAYLDRRFVGDHDFAQVDEALIAASLADDADVEGIGLVVDAPATGTLRDRVYRDQDDKSVYSALRELTGAGGPEWTIDVDWSDASQTAVTKVVRLRPRIGHPSTAPNAVFSTGSASAVMSSVGATEARYEFTEDYSAGAGANHIVATSSGEGDSRPQSAPARDEDLITAGWPRWEYRYSPSSSIRDTATLAEHAAATLAMMALGARSLTVTGRADAYPILGRDWAIGDDVGYELVGHRHPAGLAGVARAIGWTLDPTAGTAQPILLPPSGEVLS